jgi:hypothetical protein
MGFSVTKDGPYFTSGSISLSQLRSTFGGGSANISLSGYRRDANVLSTSPRVPDATENASIPTTNSNIRFSNYRNSIKAYFVNQSGTDLNANLSGQNWNSNLNKNIPKRMNIQGTCGSNSTGSFAATFSATAYNLSIDVTGSVLGAGGAGGVVGSNTGKSGGPALSVSSSGRSILIIPRGAIYGGGGGGAKGINGNPGTPGTCFFYQFYTTGTACGSCPGCGSDTRISCNDRGGCNCNKKGCRSRIYDATCRRTVFYSVPGAAGGLGGNGGNGQGYNQGQSGGAAGAPGSTGGCPNFGGPGDPGQRGGSGGGWGSSGSSVSRYGRSVSGGGSGRGISGSNYSVDNGSFGGSTSNVRGGF